MMKKMIHASRPTLMRSTDYMPWHNEHSIIGTAYDAMINGENLPDRVCVSKYAIESDFMWENSSANPLISQISKHLDQSRHSSYLGKPSTVHFQPKPIPPRQGLFKPIKKPCFRHLP